MGDPRADSQQAEGQVLAADRGLVHQQRLAQRVLQGAQGQLGERGLVR